MMDREDLALDPVDELERVYRVAMGSLEEAPAYARHGLLREAREALLAAVEMRRRQESAQLADVAPLTEFRRKLEERRREGS